MTIEAQIKAKRKELTKLAIHKKQLVDNKIKPWEEVWRGPGRLDYDNLCQEILKLACTMPKITFDELMGKDHGEKRSLYIKVGIINLDEVKLITLEDNDYVTGEDTIARVKKFITKYPDYCYTTPYEGYTVYLFSKKPTITKISNDIMLHRGACGQVKNCPKNALIIMDMD